MRFLFIVLLTIFFSLNSFSQEKKATPANLCDQEKFFDIFIKKKLITKNNCISLNKNGEISMILTGRNFALGESDVSVDVSAGKVCEVLEGLDKYITLKPSSSASTPSEKESFESVISFMKFLGNYLPKDSKISGEIIGVADGVRNIMFRLDPHVFSRLSKAGNVKDLETFKSIVCPKDDGKSEFERQTLTTEQWKFLSQQRNYTLSELRARGLQIKFDQALAGKNVTWTIVPKISPTLDQGLEGKGVGLCEERRGAKVTLKSPGIEVAFQKPSEQTNTIAPKINYIFDHKSTPDDYFVRAINDGHATFVKDFTKWLNANSSKNGIKEFIEVLKSLTFVENPKKNVNLVPAGLKKVAKDISSDAPLVYGNNLQMCQKLAPGKTGPICNYEKALKALPLNEQFYLGHGPEYFGTPHLLYDLTAKAMFQFLTEAYGMSMLKNLVNSKRIIARDPGMATGNQRVIIQGIEYFWRSISKITPAGPGVNIEFRPYYSLSGTQAFRKLAAYTIYSTYDDTTNYYYMDSIYNLADAEWNCVNCTGTEFFAILDYRDAMANIMKTMGTDKYVNETAIPLKSSIKNIQFSSSYMKSWGGGRTGFYHDACGTGLVFENTATGFKYTPRFGSGMNPYKEKIEGNRPLSHFNITHPTSYILKNCSSCNCLKTLDGSGLETLLKSSQVLDWSDGYEKQADRSLLKKFPVSVTDNDCLYTPLIMLPHEVAEGGNKVEYFIPEWTNFPKTCSYDEVEASLGNIQNLSDAEVQAVKNYCKEVVEKTSKEYPLPESSCKP